MKPKSTTVKTLAALLAVALGAALPAQASTFSVTSSDNRFIVTRAGEGVDAAETVRYRTVGLSAYAGQHFTEKSGTLTFAAGQTAVTNFVTEKTPTIDAYKFQTTTQRSYRFELTDEGGFLITNAVRSITTGTQLSTTYLNREVTDLVYFTSGGSITSGSGNKYLDVTYGPSSYRQVTDGGYNQAVHTVGTGSLYGNNADLRTFLDGIGCKMYATVYFTQKEEQDGYQYIQILADNATTYDGNDPNGAVDTPSTSIYKACFILSYTPSGSVMEDDHYQFFPHRYDYVDNAAETSAGISHYEFDYNNSHLYEQKFRNNTPSYRTSTSGSLVLATSVNNLNIRFDAAGSGGDTWDFKNLKVRLALVDTASPVMLTASAAAAPGVHAKGNDLYVSVAFNEPVTCSSASLTTTWGTLSHNSGSGSNVLTFKGKISASASGSLNITSWSGTIKDLAGNELAGSSALNQSNLATLTDSHSYSISYDLAGGALPGGSASNPTSYTYESDGITLANPVRTGYNFVGWTGTGFSGLTNAVTIAAHSHGDRAYTAHWAPITYTVHFDANGGTGTMPDQCFTYDEPQALASNAFTRASFAFGGWRRAVGGATTYADGATVANLAAQQDDVVTLDAVWTPTPTWTGDGSSDSPYLITTREQLADLAAYANGGFDPYDDACYKLMADIAYDPAATNSYTPIYNGGFVFDGNGHTISGIRISRLDEDEQGLFGLFDGGVVKNLTLADSVIEGNDDIGGIVGRFYGGVIQNCFVIGTTIPDYGGAVVGYIPTRGEGTLSNCAYHDCTPARGIGNENDRSGEVEKVFALSFGDGVEPIVPPQYAFPVYGETNSYYAAGQNVIVRVDEGAFVLVNGTEEGVTDLGNGEFLFLASADVAVTHAVTYIDASGIEQQCTNFTVLASAAGDATYGTSGAESWYVVTTNVTIGGRLLFNDSSVHLILCDGASLAVTNTSGTAISADDLTIYGQTDGTGTLAANGSDYGIYANDNLTINGGAVNATGYHGIYAIYDITINGGTVSATGVIYGICALYDLTINGGTVSATATGDGGSGIIVHSGDIALGWSDLADSITASSYGFYYGNGTLSIKEGQIFTDGVDSYEGAVDPAAIAGKTLMPCLSPWKLLQKRLDAGGMVKLAIDVTATNDDATLTVTNAVTLDLNGHVIDADYRFRAIQVLEGGDLVLTNSVEGAGAIVNGQDKRYGGGVYVENGAFTMSGGSICSNIAQQGCGVYVDGRRGSFTMTGGEISGNRPPISSSTMVSGYNGGGVYMKGGMFEMSGGSIADNNAGFNGGGVYMQGGTFTMSGGSVTNNYAPQNGGGVYMDGGTFTISSGEISGNIARYSGGGVFMYNTGSGDGTFTMSGGEISGNVAYANGVDNPRGGGGVFVSGGYEGFVMTGGTIISNSVQSSSSAYGGGVCVYGSATNTISGGMISGNFVTTTASENVWTFGGGVFVDKSTFAMTGGEISGNWSSKSGGGVCVRGDERHLFMMSGGAISGNAAYCIGMNGLGGGGVFVNSGVFEMSGGEISGNTAVGGGGVYVNNNSTFAMTNSVISGNEASKGGGVYMNSGHLYVSGVSSVSGNTNSVGAANNVYLPSGKKIGVGDLSAGASIGVTTQTEPTLANPVAFASGSAADGAHFFSDDPGFAVCVENNSLCLRAITPWERLQKRLDAGGMVKLASDVTATNDDATLTVTNAVTLDLNGHEIDAVGRFRVVEVLSGGNLTLTNSVEGAGAIVNGHDMHYGGGVYVHDGGAFMMAGGTISANSANRGGGVYVDGGTIEISGGEISGNKAYGNGGGVYVTGSAFTISGGEISGNVVGPSIGTIGGGGVYVIGSSNSDCSTFTMTGGEISGNVVYASGSIDVYGGGGVYVNEYGTFAMSGGSIISNSVQSSGRAYGGGVCLKNNSGTGTMTGGTISGNFVDTTGDGNNIYAAGGGMFVNKCAFTMSGGEISGNWSSKNGGGVAVGGIGYAFVMTGGEISGNTAKCLGWYNCYGGGGVYVNNSATFAMTNSVVSGNVASKGGGVYVNVGTLRVSGSSVVSGNTNSVGQSRNVCLASSRTITVEGLAAGASIGVQTTTKPTLGNSVKFATGALAGEEEYFFSDIFGYNVELDGGNLQLAQLMAFPTYLEGADNSVRSNYVSWAARNGEDSNSEYEDAFLLNVAPAATPVGLRIDGIDVVDGGATVRVAATAGGDAVDMSQVNGVISLSAGDELGSLALTAVPSENVTYENGEATIFVPASDGTFIRARVGVATPGRP